jgi:hypothetical protein
MKMMNKKRKIGLYLILCLIAVGLGFTSANPRRIMIDDLSNNASEWTSIFGGSGDDLLNSLVQTLDGGYVVVGKTSSYGAGGSDTWLVKTNATGQPIWNQTYGGPLDDNAISVIQLSDGYAIAGNTKSFGAGARDFWLIKTDTNGLHEWNCTYGGPADDVFREIIHTSDGGFALLGGTSSYGIGDQNWWLVKTDVNGEPEWNMTYGGSLNDRGLSLIQTSDGGFALEGGTTSFGAGGSDYWLIKTDANGQPEWNQTYGGSQDDFGNVIIQTSEGGFAIAGGTKSYGMGNYDLWLVKTNASGHHEWNQTYGGGGDEGHCESFVQTKDGGFALGVETTSYGAGDADFWLVRTDSSGQHMWNKTFGGFVDDWPQFIIQTTTGEFVLAGWTLSYGAGGSDAWLIKTTDSAGTTTTTMTTTTTKPGPGFEYSVLILGISVFFIAQKWKRRR